MSDTICTFPIPGPQGTAGSDGEDGTDGVNAYTSTTAAFTMPAEGSNVTISVGNSDWLGVDQAVWIEVGGAKGTFEVVSKPTSTSLEVQNLESTASSLYTENSAPGTNFASGATVSPAGRQGPDGAAPADALLAANNLSDVDTPATARTNLGLGDLAILNTVNDGDWSGTDLAVTNGGTGASTASDARTNLGLGSLATASTINNSNWSGTDLAITNGGTGASTAADARDNLEVLPGYGLLASSDAVDLNSATTDTAVTVNATRYLIDKITLENPSAAVTTATMGLFTAAGGGGTTLCADQALSGSLTATTKIMHLTKQSVVDSDSRTDGTLYVRVGSAEGSAATTNVKIYGWRYAA